MKIRVLLVVMMFGWAGCTQQREVVVAEKERYDPTTHEIIRIDTVGVRWGMGYKGMDTVLWKDWGGFYAAEDSLEILFINPVRGMTAIYELDTVFVPLVPLLVSQEEQKAFREWVGSLAVSSPHK